MLGKHRVMRSPDMTLIMEFRYQMTDLSVKGVLPGAEVSGL